MAAPIPLDAPVTMATLPDSFCCMTLLLNRGLSIESSPDHEEDDGRQGDAEQGHADHAGEDRGPEGAAHLGAGALGEHEGQDAKDERQRGHDDRAETYPGSLHRGVEDGGAFLLAIAGELDNQDG